MIQIHKTDKHNRTVLFTGLPVKHRDDLPQLEVRINYTGESHCGNAIPLDTYVIPAIHAAFRSRDKLLAALLSTNCDVDAEGYFCNCPLADGIRPDADHSTSCVDARHAIDAAEGRAS